MGLNLEAFREPTHRGPLCTFGRLLTELDTADLEVVQTALDDPTIPTARIAEVLQANGHEDMKEHTVGRHRRGKCSC